ncbi:MAG: hypothetical protein ACREX9_13115 [Gammaproteobacteria bacterium]
MAVDGLLVLLADLQDAAAEGSLEEGRDAFLRQLFGSLLDLLFGRLAGDAGQFPGRLDLCVRVTGVQQRVREIGEGLAAREVLERGELRRAELALQSGEATGERGEGIGI